MAVCRFVVMTVTSFKEAFLPIKGDWLESSLMPMIWFSNGSCSIFYTSFFSADRNGRRPCPQCTKVISNKSNLLKHIRIRHSDAYNPACCVLCNKIFKNKYSLRAHLNIYHKEYISPMTQQQPLPALQAPGTPEQPTQQAYPVTPTTANQQYTVPT